MPSPPCELAASLNDAFPSLTPAERLARLRCRVGGRIVLSTSFGIEDQLITHLIAEAGLDVALVTLDTGRLFPETYEVWAETERLFGLRIAAYYPDAVALEALVERTGIDGFYRDVASRRSCCDLRKTAPLRRALAGASGWITGLRADQSDHRQGLAFVSNDPVHELVKANPLFDHTRQDVADFVAAHGIPVNRLHARGFMSIGCAPCTRAVEVGEPERAGRWWWEDEGRKECGLHVARDGRLVPAARREPVAP
jgi:phosphoadenosine phosphosulfate reductase